MPWLKTRSRSSRKGIKTLSRMRLPDDSTVVVRHAADGIFHAYCVLLAGLGVAPHAPLRS
ncbi:hypothetical protein BGY98DRAFT_1052189, partial [Russula aff. rugulosa BPL654]